MSGPDDAVIDAVSSSPAVSRRRVLQGAGALAGAAAVVAVPQAAGAATGPSLVGRSVADFLAQIDQDGAALVSYGYLTSVAGVDDSLLFTDPHVHSEATALFTAYASGALVARAVHGAVTVLDVEGSMDFFQRDSGGATFADPASFQVGRRVAAYSLLLQDVLTVIAPNTGIPTLNADMTQTDARATSQGLRFGRTGQRLRMSATGLGTRSDAVAPKATLTIAGNLVAV